MRSFDRIVSHQLRLMTLLLVIHQRPIDICVHDQALQIVLGEQLRILSPAKRGNLPSGFSVVGLHLCQTLNDEFFSHLVPALAFLAKFSAESALAKLSSYANGAH